MLLLFVSTSIIFVLMLKNDDYEYDYGYDDDVDDDGGDDDDCHNNYY